MKQSINDSEDGGLSSVVNFFFFDVRMIVRADDGTHRFAEFFIPRIIIKRVQSVIVGLVTEDSGPHAGLIPSSSLNDGRSGRGSPTSLTYRPFPGGKRETRLPFLK